MKILSVLLLLLGNLLTTKAQNDSLFIRKIYDEALENGQSYQNLKTLCKSIGHRISGSKQAEDAIRFSKHLLNNYDLDTVYLQEVKVQKWIRGKKEFAQAENEKGEKLTLNVLALGGSSATQGILITEILKVQNIDELKKLDPKEIKGKTVFFNESFDEKYFNTFDAYSHCYPLRGDGPNEAAKMGASAVLVRSLTNNTNNIVHTGVTSFDPEIKTIPCAAISTQHANDLIEWITNGKIKLHLEMNCQTLPDVLSYNVIGEIRGIDNKIITMGAHLDSWDVGEGAHDNGAGVMHCIEAIRILKKLNFKPQHTIRCVLFMNEENGNMGGETYAKQSFEKNETHLMAIESDRGGFLPMGFDVMGTDSQLNTIKQFSSQLNSYDLFKIQKGFSGVDIMPLVKYYPEMMQLGLFINSQAYFDYHHSYADVFETVNKRELELGTAAMATIIYLMDKTLK